MKFFWIAALIAFLQIIALASMMKCINHKKVIPAILLFLAKAVSYYFIVHAFVDNIIHAIEYGCGYLVGLTAGPILLYLFCYFLYPLVISRLVKLLWQKFIAIPQVRKTWDKISDKAEGFMHRAGIGNKRGFKVKKVKF